MAISLEWSEFQLKKIFSWAQDTIANVHNFFYQKMLIGKFNKRTAMVEMQVYYCKNGGFSFHNVFKAFARIGHAWAWPVI